MDDKRIVIYETQWIYTKSLNAGVLISKGKGYKIRPFESKHFDGNRQLIKESECIAVVPPSEDLIKYLVEADSIRRDFSKKLDELKKTRDELLDEIKERIKLLQNHPTANPDKIVNPFATSR